jgi:phage minor structural protein
MSEMLDFYIDERFLQSSICGFKIRAEDPKAVHLREDVKIEASGQPFFITDVVKSREAERAMVEIIAEAGWMRLADIKRVGTFLLTGVSVSDGLNAILSETGWAAVQVSDQPGAYSIEATDASVLELIWQWAKITGNEVSFESFSRVITMLPQVGANRGLSFRYGRNLKSIKRTAKPPQATRVFAFGRNDLNLTSETGGLTYVEDYSYYTSQGMSLEDAQLYYRKDDVIQDDSFIQSSALHEAAQLRLSILSQPQVTYEMSVIDLSRLTGFREDDFGLGDTVYVYDDVLDINVQARVSRIVRYPYEPQRNQVELTSGPIIIPDQNTRSARSSTTQSWELFESQNRVGERLVRNFNTILHRIKLRTIENAEWVIGYSIKAVAKGDSTVTIEFVEDGTSEEIWPTKVMSLTDGQEVEFNFTMGQKERPSGEYVFVVRGSSDTAGAGLDIEPNGTAFWILARGSTRENVVLQTSIRYDATGSIQTFEVPDDVFEVLIEAHGSAGAGPSGGPGGMVKGRFPVLGGQVYDIYVGCNNRTWSVNGQTTVFPDGGIARDSAAGDVSGTFGGGSSQVRPQGGLLSSALLVAAGGGGHNPTGLSRPGTQAQGGYGGFYRGGDGWGLSPAQTPGVARCGYGADQDLGDGATSLGGDAESDGGWNGQGQGGRGADTSNAFHFGGGSGGGGWYGGAGAGLPTFFGGGSYAGDGGGGCGWFGVTGYDLEIEDGENTEDGYIIISWEDPGGE